MNQKYLRDPLIKDILDDLESRFSEHIVSVFGIGSYFDGNLPPKWIKNDVDLVVIFNSLENIPKQDWTEVRYEKKQAGGKEIWIGFNSLEGVKNRKQFQKESFASYQWSLLELKLPDNSALLYGRNVRSELPEVAALEFDYDDIIIRSLYHLNNSFKEGITPRAMREFTKGAFKFGFYLCIFFDPQFRFTSIVKIAEKIKQLISSNKISNSINAYLEEAVIYRITSQFKSEFKSLRDDFVKFVFNSLIKGSLHKKMDKPELVRVLSTAFSGLAYLVRLVRKMEVQEQPIIEPNSKSITRIKEIEGRLIFETDKAVRIRFKSGKECWIPKSTINSKFDPEKKRYQKFLIEDWILENNKVI